MTKKANCLAFGSTRPTEELLPKPLRVVTFTAGEGATTGEKKKTVCKETKQQRHTSSIISIQERKKKAVHYSQK